MATTGLYASLTVAQLQSKLVELGIKFTSRERKAALLERYRQAVEAAEPPAPSAVDAAAGACTSTVSSPPRALATSPSPVKVKEDEEEQRKEVEGTPCSTTIPASTGTESGSELEPPFKRARQGSPARGEGDGKDEIGAEEDQQEKIKTGDDRGEDQHKVAGSAGAKWASEDEDMPAAPQAPCHRAMPPGSAPVTPQPMETATEASASKLLASGSSAKGHGSLPGTPPVGGSPAQVKQLTDVKEVAPEAPETPVASPGAAVCSPEGSPVARAAWATEQAGKPSGSATGLVGSPERTPERNAQAQSEIGDGCQQSTAPGEPEASKVLDMDSKLVKEDLSKKVVVLEDSKEAQEKDTKTVKKDNKRRPVEPKLSREVKEKDAAKKEKEEMVSKDEESKDTEEPAWKKARHEKPYSSTADSWQSWNSGWEENTSSSAASSWNTDDKKKWHSWQDWSEEGSATKEPEWTHDRNKDAKDDDWSSKSWKWDDNNPSSSSSSWDEKSSWRGKRDDWGGGTSKWSSDKRWQGSDESASWEDCRKNEQDQDESSWKSSWGETKEQNEGSQDSKEGSSSHSTSWEGSWSSWTQDEAEWSGGSSGSSHTAESASSGKGGDAWSWNAGKGSWPPRPPPASMRMPGGKGKQMRHIIGQLGPYGWPPSPQEFFAAAWWGAPWSGKGRIVPPPRRPPVRPPQQHSLPSRVPAAEELQAAAEPMLAADAGASGSTEQVAAVSPTEGAAPENAPGQEPIPQDLAAPELVPSGSMPEELAGPASQGSPENTSGAKPQPADPRAAFAKYGFPQFLKQWQQWQDVIFAGWPPLPAGWVRCFSKTRDTVYFTRVRDLFTTFEESEVVPDVEQSQS